MIAIYAALTLPVAQISPQISFNGNSMPEDAKALYGHSMRLYGICQPGRLRLLMIAEYATRRHSKHKPVLLADCHIMVE